jgi:hypothetical protein
VPSNCPADEDILLDALHLGRHPDQAIARHVRDCPTCRERVDALRGAAWAVDASTSNARVGDGECLSEVALAQLADGQVAPETRAQLVAHLVGCGHCRAELVAVVDLLRAPSVNGAIANVRHGAVGRPWRGWLVSGLGLAAAVTFAVAWPRSGDPGPGTHRAPAATAGSLPIPAAPSGDIAKLVGFRWGSLEGADRYRISLYEAGGREIFEGELTDTVATLPDTVTVVPGRSYLWRVEARTGLGRWVSSELTEFRLTGLERR